MGVNQDSSRKILLVEDNPDDQELMRLALAECAVEVEVMVSADGGEALELLAAAGPTERPPALALIDVNLPKVGGIEVLRRLRANRHCRHVPVVMLSTSSEECDLRDAYAAGANSYVVKPVDFGEFQRLVCLLSDYWLTLNRPHPVDG